MDRDQLRRVLGSMLRSASLPTSADRIQKLCSLLPCPSKDTTPVPPFCSFPCLSILAPAAFDIEETDLLIDYIEALLGDEHKRRLLSVLIGHNIDPIHDLGDSMPARAGADQLINLLREHNLIPDSNTTATVSEHGCDGANLRAQSDEE